VPTTTAPEPELTLVTFRNLTSTRPAQSGTIAWPALAARLGGHVERQTKDGPGWSPTLYKPGTTRANENVLKLSALVFDFDHCEPPWVLLAPYEYVASTTFSHREDDPHWRVVLPLSSQVASDEWEEFWEQARQHLAPNADESCKDVSRFYYWPAHPPGAPYDVRQNDGDVLRPEDVPSRPDEPAAETWVAPRTPATDDLPGEDFNQKTTWQSVLGPRGWKLAWKRGATEYWLRPGDAHSAYSAKTTPDGNLYVWSSGAAPLNPRTSYTRFGAYAELEHQGDYQAAAEALGEQGYGAPPSPIDLTGITERRNGTAPTVTPLATPAAGGPPPGVNQTDRGNALRLVTGHGADLRYCYEFGRWYAWQGTHFSWDITGEVERRAKDTVTGMLREAATLTDGEERKALAKHALKSESAGGLRAMIALTQSELPIAVRSEQLDADRMLFNTKGGTLETTTGQIREHRRADLITKVAPVVYDPDATCPTLDAFLERVLPDAEVRSFVQRAAGYSLTGSTVERMMFVLHGVGRNGKSTLLEVLREVFGDYATVAPTELLLVKRNEGIPNDLARLKGARFVTAAETEKGRRMAEGIVKQITGGDTITARFLHAEFFEFSPQFKLWFSTNHKPVIQGTDEGIWDRICLVPFTVRIPDEEVDPDLPAKLRAETAGILNWLLKGLADWRAGGLKPPAAVLAATESYRQEMDVLGAFFEEVCDEAPQFSATAKALYGAYKAWCGRSSEEPETQRAFGMRLTERGLTRHRKGSGYEWLGIGIRKEEASDDGEPADLVAE